MIKIFFFTITPRVVLVEEFKLKSSYNGGSVNGFKHDQWQIMSLNIEENFHSTD